MSIKEVSTVNVQSQLGEWKYPSNIAYLQSVVFNIRRAARALGYDLWQWNDAQVLLLEDVIDDEADARAVLESL